MPSSGGTTVPQTQDVKIADHIEEALRGREPGSRLPSERDLATRFGVQRLTVRAALKRLEREGRIVSIGGSGHYVAERKIERNLASFQSLTEAIGESGRELSSRLVAWDRVEADKRLGQRLGVPLGEALHRIRRLRFADRIPLTLETSWIPLRLAPELEGADLETGSLYAALEARGVRLVSARQEILMAFASEDEADLLEVEEGEALLLLRGVAFDGEGQSVEFSTSLTRGDRCVFRSVLTKDRRD